MGVTRTELEEFRTWALGRLEAGAPPTSLESLAAEWRAAGESGRGSGGGSVGAILRRSGVIGAVRSGVGDLSTNRAHMAGFGE